MRKAASFTLYGMLILIGTVTVLLAVFWLPSAASTAAVQNPDYANLQVPVLFGIYVTLFPFLLSITEAWKLVKVVLSNHAKLSLTRIKWCAYSIAGIYSAGIGFLLLHQALHPGLAVIGLTVIVTCFTAAAFAVFMRHILSPSA